MKDTKKQNKNAFIKNWPTYNKGIEHENNMKLCVLQTAMIYSTLAYPRIYW